MTREMRLLFERLCVVARLAVPMAVLTASCADETSEPADSVASQDEALAASHAAPTLTPQVSGTINRLDSVAPVNERVVWASGRAGTVVRTIDGGATWETRPIPGAETLAFRDIHAESKNVAFVLSNNGGPNARIYKTEDGGETWTLQFQSPIDNTFYDCFAFWGPNKAITMADSINGRFPVIRTLDGKTWQDIGDRLPPDILRRGKQGFGVPFGDWFRGPLAGLVRDVLDPARLRRDGIFDAARVGRLVDAHLRGERDQRKALWSLLAFELWRLEYLGDASVA